MKDHHKIVIKVILLFILGCFWISSSFGNNRNAIEDIAGSEYYWVGGTGNWSDLSHWATTSGGSENHTSLPDQTSDVFFDENSFSESNQEVQIDIDTIIFATIDWSKVQFNPSISGDRTHIKCYGSINLSENMTFNIPNSSLALLSNVPGQVIDLAKNVLQSDIYLMGQNGEWILMNDFQTTGKIWMYEGKFNTNGYLLSMQTLISDFANNFEQKQSNAVLVLNNSNIRITGTEQNANAKFNELVIAGSSTIIMPKGGSISTRSSLYDVVFLEVGSDLNHSRLFINDENIPKSFHNLTFYGRGYISMVSNLTPAEMTFNKITFHKNADFFGSPFSVDSLIFSPGGTYNFGIFEGLDNHQIKINSHLSLRGESCQPITLRNHWEDQTINFVMSSGIVEGSYLNLRGIHVGGGTQFYAGAGSIDLGNNSGWIFEDAPGFVDGFLGQDITLCDGESFTLDPGFNTLDNSYEWNTGETSSNIEVNQTGTYWVKVIFEGGCEQTDSINVTIHPTIPESILGEDQKQCEGAEVVLNAYVEGATYLWQDGSTDSTFTATSSGSYSVEVSNQCGTVSDQIQLTFESMPSIDLGNNQAICEGSEVVLDATLEGASYLWQDGSSEPTFLARKPGIYSVEVTNSCGTVSDEIEISFAPTQTFSYSKNTYCNGEDNPLPIVSTSSDMQFSSQTGLSINDTTGEINLAQSASGTYTIYIESEECFDNYQFEIIIANIELENAFLIKVKGGNCAQKGHVEIDREKILGGTPPYSITLSDLQYNVLYTLNDNQKKFTHIPEGEYLLSVEDKELCKTTWSDIIQVHLDESDCRSTVMSPNNGETLTVTLQGLVHIYSSSGKLIRQFNAPGEWDGSDQNGQLVPMGNYLLISDEDRNKIMEVTIIR